MMAENEMIEEELVELLFQMGYQNIMVNTGINV